MSSEYGTTSRDGRRNRPWPWLVLAALVVPAVWHVVDFESHIDSEYPGVVRPTFSRLPPAAYRLAEPGDTLDRVAIYLSALTVVLTVTGLVRAREGRGAWWSASAVALGAFWFAANPGPTFDGWHGIGWQAVYGPSSPFLLRATLLVAAVLLAGTAAWGGGCGPSVWASRWRVARTRGAAFLFALAGLLAGARVFEFPDVEPIGYWPRWAFIGALAAYALALGKVLPRGMGSVRRTWRLVGYPAIALGLWYGLVVGGIALTWYHRPIDRLRTVVPGKIYMGAMPTARGLEVAHGRHHFKTIINLFPEDTPYRSPRLPDELRFAQSHGIRYVGAPSDVASSNDFLDLTLRLAQDPSAWPVLVHCHACMDRTPAWVGIYRFVVEGRPLDEVFRFIEGHRGSRPKASVTLLYNRALARLSPGRFRDDPTGALIRRCAAGTSDPYYDQLPVESSGANRRLEVRVRAVDDAAATAGRATLTPRR